MEQTHALRPDREARIHTVRFHHHTLMKLNKPRKEQSTYLWDSTPFLHYRSAHKQGEGVWLSCDRAHLGVRPAILLRSRDLMVLAKAYWNHMKCCCRVDIAQAFAGSFLSIANHAGPVFSSRNRNQNQLPPILVRNDTLSDNCHLFHHRDLRVATERKATYFNSMSIILALGVLLKHKGG